MRARLLVSACLSAGLVLGLAAPALAQTGSPNSPSSGQLVEQPKEYDGKRVEFAGEVIGEAMFRGEHAWIHINDDSYYLKNVEEGAELGGYNSGMAVWLPASQLEPVGTYGDYKHEGDVVEVAGVFNAACAEHGGDMDIHAEFIEVLTPGHGVTDPVHGWKIWMAIVLAAAAAVSWWFSRERLPGGA